MTSKCLCLFSAMIIAAASAASAATIPYPGIGVNTEVYSLTAANTGAITAYFYSRSDAAYTETLGLQINGVPTGITGLNNHTSSPGQSLILGYANIGDALTFFINVQDTDSIWYSNPSLNSDGINHVYSATFAGNTTIPAGTYVGFEDLARGVADYNYADEQFVFPNTALIVATPEPPSWALLGLEIAALFGILGRHKAIGKLRTTRNLRELRSLPF
jgi:hypothetical protein